ncbi:MAG: SDR family oxidoreductase [Bilophila wadsworthia]
MSTPVALVLGGHGLLGQPLAQQLAGNGWEAQSLDFEDCNLLNPVELQPRIEFINPDVIFNTVSWNTENPAEKQPQEALSVNRGLPAFLGGLVKGTSRFLVHYSSDQVFNGRKDSPYTEEDKADPISLCGKSRPPVSRPCRAQRRQHLHHPYGLAVRPGWDNFLKRLLGRAKTEGTVEVIHDQIGSPTYAKDLAQATLQLVKRRAPGLYHVANSGQATWCELAAEAVRQASLPCSVRAVASSDKTLRANYEVLSSAKYTALTGCPMRPWSQALREYIYSVLLASQ